MTDTLIERIDSELQRIGKTRAQLARHMGISTQAIHSLGRRRAATMTFEHLRAAAQFLGCSFHWLATGAQDDAEPRVGYLVVPVDAATLPELLAIMV